MSPDDRGSIIGAIIDAAIRFCLENKLIVCLVVAGVLVAGAIVMPFDYETDALQRHPVPVDAIPDIGENQQIVFTSWMGRSPQDIEDQITYPLTVSLMGVPGVKTIRSNSFLGFSSISVVFKEGIEFYWSRARILERLSVARKDLPQGVNPALGPDATALGQIFWYTLEGRDPKTGKPAGGWDLGELRSTQDWYVRLPLQSADGVSEVASVGGFVREYQVDVDPDLMRHHDVTLAEIYDAVRQSNIDVGARTIEINSAEYLIRGLGFLRNVDDLRKTVVKSVENVPIYLDQVAEIGTGPAMRRGALDKEGAEAVGGVVIVRYGENPLEVIKNVKQKIEEIAPGLPSKTLADGTVSKLTIVPFYDRTQLIHETLDTLENALTEEIMVTIIVVIVMMMHLRSSVLISSLLPLAVLMAFIAMKTFGVDSNIMSLSGIAIAIGTMVDMGVILCENILKHLDDADPEEDRLEVIFRATSEVGRPVLTAILTTVVSFLPVFFMTGAEGKLFKPLAFTKTFALLASVIVALTLIPPFAHMLFGGKIRWRWLRFVAAQAIIVSGILAAVWFSVWVAVALVLWGLYLNVRDYTPPRWVPWLPRLGNGLAVVVVLFILTRHWMPLGPELGLIRNLIFIGGIVGGLLTVFLLFMHYYERMLRFFLAHTIIKLAIFIGMPLISMVTIVIVLVGIPKIASTCGISDKIIEKNPAMAWAGKVFPGLGKEFMPPLDEGSYLLMPTTMPHASIGEALDVLKIQDMAIGALPEVESVVGKIGRVDSPLDPAPVSMIETIINYRPKYLTNKQGQRRTFRFDPDKTDYARDASGEEVHAPDGMPYKVQGRYARHKKDDRLIEDSGGIPFSNWRPPLDPKLNPGRAAWEGIRKPDDIWTIIEAASLITGTTRAPKLQPIATRLVMLQSGIRAPMAVKILGQKLEDIERVGLKIEEYLKSGKVAGIKTDTVLADRIVGKPYIEIEIDRERIARHPGITVRRVQDVIETAIGGQKITTTVEGRERYPVRVRYQRELRNSIESIEGVLIAANDGSQIPLGQLAEIKYVRGPQAIKSQDTKLVGYVIFDKEDGYAEVDVVEAAREYLKSKIKSPENPDGEYELPDGTDMPVFIGSYENQVRSAKTLMLILPLAFFLIFIILYLQFRSVLTTGLVFCGVAIAWSGGFMLLWLYSKPWFGDFAVFGVPMQELFQIHALNMSVAVWVGFIALLGIATDDGVVMASYLDQSFRRECPTTAKQIREATVRAGKRRIRPCLMTTATTILALIPVLTSSGRGADVMVPMALPSFGGMMIELMTLFFVPVSYCMIQELRLKLRAYTASVAKEIPK